jgi:hypothetical protein
MHGIKEINFQNEHAKAKEILANNPPQDIDNDYRLRQEALDNYLKAKYGKEQQA